MFFLQVRHYLRVTLPDGTVFMMTQIDSYINMSQQRVDSDQPLPTDLRSLWATYARGRALARIPVCTRSHALEMSTDLFHGVTRKLH